MPRYDFHCPTCRTTEERQVRLKLLDVPQRCDTCGAKLARLFVPAQVVIEVPLEFTGSQLVGTIRADNQHGEPRTVEEKRKFDAEGIRRVKDRWV